MRRSSPSIRFACGWLLAFLTNFRSFGDPGAHCSADHFLRGHPVKRLLGGVSATTETKVASGRSFRFNIVVIDPDGGGSHKTSPNIFLLVIHFDYLDGFAHSFFSEHLAESCERRFPSRTSFHVEQFNPHNLYPCLMFASASCSAACAEA